MILADGLDKVPSEQESFVNEFGDLLRSRESRLVLSCFEAAHSSTAQNLPTITGLKRCMDGTRGVINKALRRPERQRQNRQPKPTAGIIDGQSVKTVDAINGYDIPSRTLECIRW